jgi:cation diffusion facilitator CzcD-associated flavoprotein CzcO
VEKSPKIAIIGTGFGGIGAAIYLQKAGIIDFTLYERASSIGGVWRDNIYPGAACDIPSHLYSFSFEHHYPWSRRYAPQSEILAYLNHCADKYGIRERIAFDREITSAVFDASRGKWKLLAGDFVTEADILISAVGQFSHPVIPDIPGRESFAGSQFHSSRWESSFHPHHRRVALIGTGASSIQIGPAIAPEVKRLMIFQRSAAYVFPKGADAFPPQMQARFGRFPVLRSLDRFRIYASYEARIPRRRSPRLVAKSQAGFLDFLATQISEADLRREMTPDHPWGCKRVLLSNEWYQAISRSNVEIVRAKIVGIEPRGLRTADGRLHEADAIIYGTGFAPAEFLKTLHVVGLNGVELAHAWSEGAEAYLGTTVAGFPNFFLMFGPNTNIPGSVVYMLESQARYIVKAVQALYGRHIRYAAVRREVQQAFNETLQKHLRRTVWSTGDCTSWFKASSGKITTQWPGFLFSYRRLTRRIRRRDYDVVG